MVTVFNQIKYLIQVYLWTNNLIFPQTLQQLLSLQLPEKNPLLRENLNQQHSVHFFNRRIFFHIPEILTESS